MDVGQGNKFNGSCKSATQNSVKTICDWFKQYVGQMVDVPVISMSGLTSEACPSNYVGRAYIVGYATYRVLAVNCTASAAAPRLRRGPGGGLLPGRRRSLQHLRFREVRAHPQLVCNHLNGANHSTGCAWTGTSPLRPVLVR